MIVRRTWHAGVLCLALWLAACGAATTVGTGVGNPPGLDSVARAATAALAAGDTAANIAAHLSIVWSGKSASCTGPQRTCFCEQVADGASFPTAVSAQLSGLAGNFGASGAAVTLAVEDYCMLSDGTSNPLAGPDDLGRYATFTLIGDMPLTCTNSVGSTAVTLQATSTGVFRNVDEADLSIRHEIAATFLVTADGASATLRCSLAKDASDTITSAVCTDADDATVTQDTTVSCHTTD